MAEYSKIDYLLARDDTEEPGGTWSPWLGCSHVSKGCAHCWAEAWASRFSNFRGHWGPNAPRYFFEDSHWKQPLRWNYKCEDLGKRKRVLVSLCDPFERALGSRGTDMDDARIRLWSLVRKTQCLDWLVLTKRPENMQQWRGTDESAPRNLWLGVSVEDQQTADERIPLLLEVPAAVRWVSYEPALGPVTPSLVRQDAPSAPLFNALISHGGIDWVVVGCESGPKARPMAPYWADNVVRQCAAAGVPCFVKQLPKDGISGRIIKSADLAKLGYPVQLPEVRR